MNLELREEIVHDLRRAEDRIRLSKGKAYSGNEDTLANFKRNADRLGMSPFQVWAVYFNKHIDSINTAISRNPDYPIDSTEGLDGRIMDARIYLEILKCLLYEFGQDAHKEEGIGFSPPAGSLSSVSSSGAQ